MLHKSQKSFDTVKRRKAEAREKNDRGSNERNYHGIV